MTIIKQGDPKKTVGGEFSFHCKNCGCEWLASRKEVKINPPCLPFAAYMKCPNCKKSVNDREY